MAMLIKLACKTMGSVEDCDRVKEASAAYRKSQNYFAEFMAEKIRAATSKDRIKKTEIYEEFKNWYQINYGKNIPKGREIYDQLDKKLGKYNKGWYGYTINYDDDDEIEVPNDECIDSE